MQQQMQQQQQMRQQQQEQMQRHTAEMQQSGSFSQPASKVCMDSINVDGATPFMEQKRDDSTSATAKADQHLRCDCPLRAFLYTDERIAQPGSTNSITCPLCCCLVCGGDAANCNVWLSEAHCNANEKDIYWLAHRKYNQTDLLCNSPLLSALNCDAGMRADSKQWCIEGLIAFERYREGAPSSDGLIEHSFGHVADIASAGMKTIVGHLSGSLGPRGPCTTLAILDGITTGIVVNTWRPLFPGDPGHRWCKGTYKAYRAIVEQLEKYWVLAVVYTSGRNDSPFPPSPSFLYRARTFSLSHPSLPPSIPSSVSLPLSLPLLLVYRHPCMDADV